MNVKQSVLNLCLSFFTAGAAIGQPVITAQPASQAVLAGGETATFTVKASGAPPLTFHWRRNDVLLTGKTSATLTLLGVTLDQAGSYTVVVTDANGSVTSQPAWLFVESPKPLVSLNQRWRFDDSAASLVEQWKEPGFDDSSWREAEAPFVNEAGNLAIPKTTSLALTNTIGQRVNTYYFRTRFDDPVPSGEFGYLILTNYVDDGAIFYLNGIELTRLRMQPGPVNAATSAIAASDARATVMYAFAGTQLLRASGNVLAVEVHQHPDAGTPDLVFGMTLSVSSRPPQLADLVVWDLALQPRLEEWTFKPDDCEVREGLVQAGQRRLLRFTTQTRNIGTADLAMGSPAGNPLFVLHPCHGHYHFAGFVAYRLRQHHEGGPVIVDGGKPSFALEDSERWDPEANATARFSNDNSGIQRGWADTYSHVIPGQWLDITAVSPGQYWLELELDPDNRIPELYEDNNKVVIRVTIPADFPACDGPPANDNFADAQVIPIGVANVLANTRCATRERNEPRIPSDNPDRPGGPSVWFRWTPSGTGPVKIATDGSNFDTVLALYRGTNLTQLTRVAFNDEGGIGSTSRLTANVTAGTEYRIAVEGYYSFLAKRADSGDLVLSFGHDDFADAAMLEGSEGSVIGNTFGATWQDGEGSHREFHPDGGGSVWYEWRAPRSETFTFLVDSQQQAVVQIYEGDALASLVPRGRDGGDAWSRAKFEAEAGRSYRIVVASWSEGALFTLRWDRPVLHLAPVGLRSGDLVFDVHFDLSRPRKESQIQVSDDLIRWTPWRAALVPNPDLPPSIRITAPISGTQHRFFRVIEP